MTTDAGRIQFPPKLDGLDVLVAVGYRGYILWHAVPATGWMKHKGWWLFYNEDKLVAQFKEREVESIMRRS